MDFEKYAKFANEHPVCYIATSEDDQPHVRPVAMWYADKTGFYFESKSVKRLCKQMQANGKVEMAFHAPASDGPGTVMRVMGKAKFIDDMAVRERVWQERPRMKAQGVKGPDDPLLAVFHVYTGEAYFWTMAENMKEADIPRANF